MISDKYIQLNGLLVEPAEEESSKISNVSTFIGGFGLVMKNVKTGKPTIIKVDAQDHSIAVDSNVIIVKDKPVTAQVFNMINITVDTNVQVDVLKDASAWLYINTEGFGIKMGFYKKHLDMFITKTVGLTKEANRLIGKFNNEYMYIASYIRRCMIKVFRTMVRSYACKCIGVNTRMHIRTLYCTNA